MASQIKELGKITKKDAKINNLIIDHKPIRHSNFFADIGLESMINIFNESPIYLFFIIEKINKNLDKQLKFRKNDIFDAGILNHINNQKDTFVLTLDQNLIELMELVLCRIKSEKDIDKSTIDNLSQSIILSKNINKNYK